MPPSVSTCFDKQAPWPEQAGSSQLLPPQHHLMLLLPSAHNELAPRTILWLPQSKRIFLSTTYRPFRNWTSSNERHFNLSGTRSWSTDPASSSQNTYIPIVAFSIEQLQHSTRLSKRKGSLGHHTEIISLALGRMTGSGTRSASTASQILAASSVTIQTPG